MCGIYGWIAGRPVGKRRIAKQVETAKAAVACLAHRGPDAQAVWHDNQAVLGHSRLGILDPSPLAAQPMVSRDGLVALVYNGEIFNYQGLRRTLKQHGHTFASHGDTEVLLAAYLQWGPDLLSRIQGMFAFGIWDSRTKTLFLARDRLGKKPLFYARHRDATLFASEPKALAEIELRPRLASVATMLSWGRTPAPSSLYAGVSQLAPAHLIVCEASQARLPESLNQTRYWRAPCAGSQQGLTPPLPHAIRKVRELTFNAVRRRLRSDVPLGIFLSGGLDSTLLAAVARRLTDEPLPSFTLGLGFGKAARYDERSIARNTAEHLGLDHHEAELPLSAFDEIETLVELYDGPVPDSSALPTYWLSRQARSSVVVALSGDGGDELFGGYHRLWAAALAERIPPWAAVGFDRISALSESLRLTLGMLPPDQRSLWARLMRFADRIDEPLPARLQAWQHPGALSYEALWRPDVLESLHDFGPMPLSPPSIGSASPLQQALLFNIETYLVDDLLIKADRCSMGAALELRSPLLDLDLVEYLCALPDYLKVIPPITKVLLRTAFLDLLPPKLLVRGKAGFGLPLDALVRSSLTDLFHSHLTDFQAPFFELFSPEAITGLLQRHMTGAADLGHALWLLLTTKIWMDRLPPSS